MPTSLSAKALRVKPSSTLVITSKANELKAQGLDVASFGAGEPDFPTPENIRKAAIEAIETGNTRYTPASGTKVLKEAISKKFKEFNHLDYAVDQIVVSNGGKHTLTNIFEAILNPGDEVIIPAPFWLSYPEMVRLSDGVPVIVTCKAENSYKITAAELEAACTDKTKAFVLNSPCNPTGAIYTEEELRAIAEVAVRKDFFVVADEMYEMLNYTDTPCVSIATFGEEIYKRTITSSGVSKSYAMTGWRIGYTGSTKELAKVMSSIQSHQTSNPCSISQAATVEALNGPQDTVLAMAKVFQGRRDLIYGRVSKMPYVKTFEPQGAFYLFVDISGLFGKQYKGREITSAGDVAEILINDYLTAVIPCADFGMADHIRLSYATSEAEINKGLDRIEKFLNEI